MNTHAAPSPKTTINTHAACRISVAGVPTESILRPDIDLDTPWAAKTRNNIVQDEK